MKPAYTAAKILFIIASALLVLFAAPAWADQVEYHCDNGMKRCSITKQSISASVYCIPDNNNWQCTDHVNEIECEISSQVKKTINKMSWNNSATVCTQLCGACSSGWKKYEGGGTTF